jgi:hypothetical protein
LKDTEYPIKKLSREEFADSIAKGLGRAYLHVSRYGLGDVSDLVLSACLHNRSWDNQVEGSRAKWLLNMFKDTSYYRDFTRQILFDLRSEIEYWDVQQLFELGKELAMEGDNAAKEAVRERALEKASKPSNDDELGSKEWMEIGGTEAALELARVYGTRLLKNPEDNLPIDTVLIDMYTPEIKQAMSEKSQTEPAIKEYWDHLLQNRWFEPVGRGPRISRRRRFRQEFPLTKVLKDAQNRKATFPGRYSVFGRYATKNELRVVYSRLLQEKSRAVRLRLLWVFRRATLPKLDDVLFKWATGKDIRIRGASLAALAQVNNTRIHELARNKLSAGELVGPDTEALSLFENNFESDDANLITQALTSAHPNREDAHSLVWSLVDIAEHHKDIKLAKALKWGYEVTPCSAHRYDVVVRLNEIGQLKGEILHESLYDANEDIVEFVTKLTPSST